MNQGTILVVCVSGMLKISVFPKSQHMTRWESGNYHVLLLDLYTSKCRRKLKRWTTATYNHWIQSHRIHLHRGIMYHQLMNINLAPEHLHIAMEREFCLLGRCCSETMMLCLTAMQKRLCMMSGQWEVPARLLWNTACFCRHRNFRVVQLWNQTAIMSTIGYS